MHHHHVDMWCGLISKFALLKSTSLLLHSARLDFYPLTLRYSFSLSCIEPSTKPDGILISIDLYVHPEAQVILENGGGILQQVKLVCFDQWPYRPCRVTDQNCPWQCLFFNLFLNTVEEQQGIGTSLINNVLKSVQLSLRLPLAFLFSFHARFNFLWMAFNGCSHLERECKIVGGQLINRVFMDTDCSSY